MTSLKDIIMDLCLLPITRKSKQKRNVDYIVKERSLDNRIIRASHDPAIEENTLMIGPSDFSMPKTEYRQERDNHIISSLLYIKDTFSSGYKAAKESVSKAYSTTKNILKDYIPGRISDPLAERKLRILDWCNILPKKTNPDRQRYLALVG